MIIWIAETGFAENTRTGQMTQEQNTWKGPIFISQLENEDSEKEWEDCSLGKDSKQKNERLTHSSMLLDTDPELK
jgi:hypothetical protein